MFVLLVQTNAIFAQRLVEGTIKSEINKQPIPFATVFVKEDNIETYADIQGKFRIEVSDKASSIYVISSGFLGQEIEFSKEVRNTTLEVFLKDNDLELKAQVVTANRVEENLQVTPVSASVIQAINIQNRSSFITTDALSVAPNVICDSWTPSAPTFSVRGMSTNLSDPGVESAVGLYIDDVYYSRGFGFNSLLMDVERIEVLRGPQGTLFGKNTVGGLINITTEKPKMANSAGLDLNFGNLGFVQARARGNYMILKNRLSARVNVGYSQRDGYIQQLDKSADSLNKSQFYGGRVGLLYTPTPRIEIDANAFYSKDTKMENSMMLLGGGYKAFDDTLRAMNSAFPNDGNPRYSNFNKGYKYGRGQFGTSLRGKFLIGKNTLNSVTSFYTERDSFIGDLDVSQFNIGQSGRTQSIQTASQEIRYASPRNQRWSYIFGLHAISERIGNRDTLQLGDAAYYALVGLPNSAVLPPFLVADPSYHEFYEGVGSVSNKNLAFFTSHTIQIVPKLRLNAGFRVTYENKTFKNYQRPTIDTNSLFYQYVSPGLYGANVPLVYGIAPPFASEANMNVLKKSYLAPSGNIGLDYRINDSIFVYGSYSRGFKGGGFNTAYSAQPSDSTLYYKPEYLDNYEIGFKSQFNNRYRINGNVFFMNYRNKQELLIENQNLKIANAALVRGWGAEIEGSAILFKGFILNFSAAHLNMKYKSFIFDSSSLEGNRVIKAPDYTAGLGLEYAKTLGDKYRVLARVDWNYTGYSYNDIRNTAALARVPANMLNARLALSDSKMRYTLAIWGKNLTNATYAQHAWYIGGLQQVAVNVGRTMGVELRYNFYK
jgi:iron complex outermembrane receptor protein